VQESIEKGSAEKLPFSFTGLGAQFFIGCACSIEHRGTGMADESAKEQRPRI